MRKSLLLSTVILLLLFCYNNLYAQNSMVGDGFGGRGWYVPHNYQAGAYSAYTVCSDSNQLYGWGSNRNGQLGNGTIDTTSFPVAATGMKNVKFHTVGYVGGVIKDDNTAWVWRNPTDGFSTTPNQLMTDVKFIDGGMEHIVFVKQDGTVWGVGQNFNGELGNQQISSSPSLTPVQMIGITNAVRAIAVYQTTIILLSDGTVKITGGAGIFQMPSTTVPVALPGLNNIVDIKGNTKAAFALDQSGDVYAFGKEDPYLGLGAVGGNVVISPTKITFASGAGPIVAISSNCDGFSALALDSSHKVYGWGDNSDGQIGAGFDFDMPTPVLVASDVIDIFAGETFSYILKADNTLWASGRSASASNIWMNLSNQRRVVFTQINPTIPPMNLCAPKVWGVVPIKLSSFTCTANGNTAYLNWQSAEETNADKYIVEYSKDGRNFQSIAIINAKGCVSNYMYVHQQVNGTAFYRLQMMDKDGSFKYSAIHAVKFNNKAGFTIAPNPANDVVYVFIKNNAVVKSIQIVSIDGQLLKILNEYNSGLEISISALAKGTYILKVIYENDEIEYGRFIKM